MWQGVMKAWNILQSGLEQQAPESWSEITHQPLFGNRFLTSETFSDGAQNHKLTYAGGPRKMSQL